MSDEYPDNKYTRDEARKAIEEVLEKHEIQTGPMDFQEYCLGLCKMHNLQWILPEVTHVPPITDIDRARMMVSLWTGKRIPREAKTWSVTWQEGCEPVVTWSW